MEFILSVITAVFVAIILSTALALGFGLLLWFLGLAVIMAAFMVLRGMWLRWRFLKDAAHHPHEGPRVIEGEYRDVSDREP